MIYLFLAPEVEQSIPVRRFRYMDISLYDAIRTGAYGHAGLSQDEILARAEAQRASLRYAEGVITASTYAADAIARDFGYPREKITPIGGGPGLPFNRSDDADPVRYGAQRILFIGRDWKRKGGPRLLDAFGILRRRLPKATLVVVGPPEPPTSAPGVEWHPPVNKGTRAGRALLERFYATSSVFCMPSYCETWGLVYVEASQRGLPVVGFDEWALPDIVSADVTGLLTPERNAEALAALLERGLCDPASLQRMGKAATDRVRHVLDWPHVVDRLLYRVAPEELAGRVPVWMADREAVPAPSTGAPNEQT